MSLLSAHKLEVKRGENTLLSGLDFSLQPGRILVVLGPNGVGKSSLLLALAGILPIQGEVLLSGKALKQYPRPDLAREIAWQGSLPPTEFGLSVDQRLNLAMDNGLVVGGEDELRRCCKALDVASLRTRMLGELSTGERQRVELAAVMLRDVPIWLLDEPTAHLDLRHQVAWLSIMRSQADAGRGILVVLHDVQQAFSVADDVVLLHGGGRVSFGAKGALLVPEVLEDLYGTRLLQLQGGDGQGVLVPAYEGGGDEAA